MTQIIGLDVGYANVKVVHANGHRVFPSVVGTPEEAAFCSIKLGGQSSNFQVKYNDRWYNVGEIAIEQSRFTSRPESRDWIESEEYQVLIRAALSLVASGNWSATIFTGLPLAFYGGDAQRLEQIFEGVHHAEVNGNSLSVSVSECVAMPQPMGTLAHAAFDFNGNIVNAAIAVGHIGVIDVGGKTTNILHASQMGDIARETASADVGVWDAMRAVRPVVEELCPDAGYSDHEISNAIVAKAINYRGQPIDLREPLDEVLEPFARRIVTKAIELWPGGGATLNTILLSGGGAVLLKDRIEAQINHEDVRLADNSLFANAMGYYKLAVYRAKQA
jgi:plasmid segregation protein ParM